MAIAHGFGETWNNTTNNLELVARAHNHCFLVLDETRATDPKTVLDSVFRLERGQEKGRITDAQPRGSWLVPVLSTSNLSVDELGRLAKIEIDDAYRSRLIDVPNPIGGHGIYEDLHGYSDVAEFSKRLIDLALEHHGCASLHFLEKLLARQEKDSDELQDWLKKRGDYYLKAAKAQFDGTGRNLSQIHERFSTIYAAGRLAQRFEILPWTPNKLRKALLACEKAHIELTQRAPQQISRATPLQRLQAYVQKHKADFPKLKKSSPATHGKSSSAPGYRNTHAGKLEYLFTKSQFNQIAGGASLAQALKSELKERGWIEINGQIRVVPLRCETSFEGRKAAVFCGDFTKSG